MRVVSALSACAAASRPAATGLLQQYESDLAATNVSPIKRILKLLEDMQGQLEEDLKEDKKMYEKMQCWCNANGSEKQADIEAAQQKIEQLNSDIESGTASASELASKITQVREELEANNQALAKATEVRAKQRDEFQTYEKEAIANIEALKAAVLVLSKANAEPEQSRTEQKKDAFKYNNQGHAGHGMNLVQTRKSGSKKDIYMTGMDSLTTDTAQLDTFMARGPSAPAAPAQTRLLAESAAPTLMLDSGALQRLKAFIPKHMEKDMASRVMTYLTQATDVEYNNQSAEIFGILNQLLEQMTTELAEAQQKDAEASSGFHELRDAKESEIESGEESESAKVEEEANTRKKLADDKEDLADTEANLDADQKFLINMKQTCKNLEDEYGARSKDRHDELSAVSDTIAILTSEEAQTLTNFVQTESATVRTVRTKAAHVLSAAAHKAKSPELSALATEVKLDAFAKVKKAMQDMVAKLQQQQKDEVKQKDFCNGELHSNEMETGKKENQEEDIQTKLQEQTSAIEQLDEDLKELTKEIYEARVELKKATEDRVEENKDYMKGVQEQQATRAILKKAIDRLAKVYGFVQQPESVEASYSDSRGNAEAKAPDQFKAYKKNENSGGALGLLKKFVKETEETESEMESQEQDAQVSYEKFVTDTNLSVKEKSQEIVNKQELKANTEQDKNQSEQDLKATQVDLEELSNYKGQLHKSCDFVLKNFDARQQARSNEIEAIRSAEAILSGAMEG
mmetsp:Transcript_38026/g.91203  ORF Transcript_38026/g.91203 Transcript_38026/m.91203 type:complete len:745 (-) Transcript_38026:79-2313(-)